MNILLINGSPRKKKSNTYRLSSAFIRGLEKKNQTDAVVTEVTLGEMKISGCLGCFKCWTDTPGKCCIKDDMEWILEKIIHSDIVIWSFPLYYFSVPGQLKMLIDRQLPLVKPLMVREAEYGGHPLRYDMSGQKNILISTCGFYTAEGNYDGVTAMFDHLFGRGNYEKIFCAQGEMFRCEALREKTDGYLKTVERAGEEYADGQIASDTRSLLNKAFLPRDVFENGVDSSWGAIDQERQEDTN